VERSLTALLPVHNVESTLATVVAEILDAASDMAERFELVIVDDCSTDATGEVIDELTRSYPQIRAIRHGEHCGQDEAIRTGLKQSTGEKVLLRNPARPGRTAAYHLLDRETMERVYRITRPARPNYLPHFLPAAPADLLGDLPSAAFPGV